MEDHTRIQTRVLRELHELKEKEKLTPKEDTKWGKIFSRRFGWTNTLFTEAE